MTGPRIAVQTLCLAQPLKQALHTVGRMECAGVQIDARRELKPSELSDTGLRQMRKLLNDLNLRVGSIAFPTRRGYGDAQDLDRRIAATLDAISLASRLGAGVVLIAPAAIPPAESAERSTLLEALTNLAHQGNRMGVVIAAQWPQAAPQEIAEVLSTLPDGLIGIDLSPADLIRSHRQPLSIVEALGQRIVHVFANDAIPDVNGQHSVDVQLGRGTADMPQLLGALEEYGYRGWITVERRNSGRTVDDVADAVQFLRAM